MIDLKLSSTLIIALGLCSIINVSARSTLQDTSLSGPGVPDPQILPYHAAIFVYPEQTRANPSNNTPANHNEEHSTRTDQISECGGAIIQQRFVLTAASCVYGLEPHRLVARAGGDVVPPPDKPHRDRRIFRRVSRIYRLRDYQPGAHAHDFALLKLSGSFDMSDEDAFGVVHLPDKINEHEDKWAVLSGYEKSNSSEPPKNIEQSHFKSLYAKVISDDECEELGIYNVTYGSLCSQINRPTGSYCGNVGDPLVYENQVIGTLSSPNGCNPDKPGLFTRISAYTRWIRGVILNQDVPDVVVIG